MIFQLLALCRCMAKYSSPCHYKVGTGIRKACINYKIFLFPSKSGGYRSYIFIKKLAHINGCFIKCNQRF